MSFSHYLLCSYYILYFVPCPPKVPPQITPFDFGEEPANVGETSTISCLVAKGDLPLDIFWSLNSKPIISGEHSVTILRMTARTSILSVDSLDAHHRGSYKCMARNKAGQSEHHSELQVNGGFNRHILFYLKISAFIGLIALCCLNIALLFKYIRVLCLLHTKTISLFTFLH